MKSFNMIGWNDYAQLKQSNPPEPGRCFPGIFFPWVLTTCHSLVLTGRPLPTSKILGIQFSCASKGLKLNQTSLMGLKNCFLKRSGAFLGPERSGDALGSKVLSEDGRCKEALPCCLMPCAIPAPHPLMPTPLILPPQSAPQVLTIWGSLPGPCDTPCFMAWGNC